MITKSFQNLLSIPWCYRLSQAVFAPGADKKLTTILNKRKKELPVPGLLLDVGCGPASWLWKIDWDPIGLDVSYEYAQAFKKNGQNATTGSAFQLPFVDEAFDGIWCIGVLHHLQDDQATQTIAEMLRVCKSNGYVIIQDAVLPESTIRRPVAALIRRMDRGKNMRTREQLEALLPDAEKWAIRRYTYTYNGLEMLECCKKKP